MKASWLLRGPRWRRFHVHRCLECGQQFADTSLARGLITAEMSSRSCAIVTGATCAVVSVTRTTRRGGPYCLGCVTRVEERLLEIREMYRD